MTASGDEPRGIRSPRNARWLRDVTDRVPTAWLPGIVTAVFLGAAAAFGGLEAVAAPPIANLQPGDEHRNDMLALTVERAVLIDSFPEAGASANAENGERVLAVVVTAENTWDRAVPAENDASLTGMLRAPSLADPVPVAAARFDDGTKEPWLQPGLPAELVVTWIIGADELAAGDELELELRDFTLQEGQIVFSGEVWIDPVVSARVSVPVTDVGSGADAQPEEEGQ
ncbi:hypothetical protein Q9S71_12580 [Microbacterium sp. KSW4-11]|uniref:DUF4352 domain-containing protein n=1 Tax=Microbacterium gawkjiense TaxID=3067309 RepID=A0ABU3GG28_9MICO|nr:hypothetical protein [Microbacterium sp. KSW4-11]MDT3317655.1 hypothetical protein [Microbacterium sp. KSW4-11]